jgi:hypothetical protein
MTYAICKRLQASRCEVRFSPRELAVKKKKVERNMVVGGKQLKMNMYEY